MTNRIKLRMKDVCGRNNSRRRGLFWLWAVVLPLVTLFGPPAQAAEILVSTPSELAAVAAQARPGDTLVMRDGIWSDADILFSANGAPGSNITLRAQTIGRVHLTGGSRLRLAGSFLVVDGLQFTNGFRTSGDVIAFQATTFSVANQCRLTNCTIVDFNPPDTTMDTKWVSLYGFSNRVDNCYFKGKSNLGSTMVVWVDGQPDRPNYHHIENNYFGFRPAYGANGAETIRVGTSEFSTNLSRTTIANNYFERCNGDAEIVSSKSLENVFRHNTFVECEGALSLRHGNGSIVEGNYFFGRLKPLTGGVRIVGEDHKVYNNYFSELMGTAARSPLAIMKGLENSPLNGYFQVKRATVAFNTFVNCTNTFLIGLDGTLTGATNVTTLPPVDCTIANNLALNSAGKLVDQRIVPLGLLYEGNIFFGPTLGIAPNAGISQADPRLQLAPDGLWRPGPTSPALGGAQGSSYAYVTEDMEGHSRSGAKDIGADQASTVSVRFPPLRAVDVGPLWMRSPGTVVSWSSPANIVYGTPLSAAQLNAVANVPGTFVYTPPAGTILNAGSGQALSLVFTPTDRFSYTAVTQSVSIRVVQAVPTIAWAHPTNIVFGTPLGLGQLAATASTAGTFVYAPAAGTVLGAGDGQTLSVTFTPANTNNYSAAGRTVTINVTKGVPVLTWASPASIAAGTPLSALQLNASANVAGTFNYAPGLGTLLEPASGQPLTVTFLPADVANYATATRTVLIDVTIGGRLVPTIHWAPPADITAGTVLNAVQLNASADVPGRFTYTPPAGTILSIGNAQALTVNFTPTDLGAYTSAVKIVTINVAPALNNAEVRIAYIIPTNRVAQSEGVANLRSAALFYQKWYRDQMALNGFGPKTFALEREADGETPVVHTVLVAETDSYLRGDIWGARVLQAAQAAGVTIGTPGQVWWLIPETHVENPDGSISGGFDFGFSNGGSGYDWGWAIFGSDSLALLSTGNMTNSTPYDEMIIPEIGRYPLTQGLSFSWFNGTTLSGVSSSALGAGMRGLGEALGLDHDFRNDENFNGNLTGFGFRGIRGTLYPSIYPYNQTRLPYAAAMALSISAYFNAGRPLTDDVKPQATIFTSGTVATVNGLVRIAFSASDAGGLAAATLSWNRDSDRVLVDELALSGTSVNQVFAIPYYDSGLTNEYTLAVTDLQGNKRVVTTKITPIAGRNHAPQPFLAVNHASIGVGEDVVFDVSGSFDPEHVASLLEVEWDLNGDGLFDTEPSSQLVYTNRYFDLGHRLIRARVTDAAGDSAVSAPVALNVTVCSVTLSPTMRTNGFGTGTGTITVQAGPGCVWNVASLSDWITITSETEVTGPATVRYALAANPAFAERTGLISIGDKTFPVTQKALVCSYSLSPVSRYHGFGAGSGTIKMTTKPECSWTIVNTNPWVIVTSPINVTGTGTVSYAVTENRTSTERTGNLQIGDQTFLVGQWGTNCGYVITPLSRTHGEESETGLVTVTSSSSCNWSATSSSSWITINSIGGTGNGTVGYSVSPNFGAGPRTGSLTVAGKTFSILQEPCGFEVSPAAGSHGEFAGNGSFNVLSGNICNWTVANTNGWISITSAASGTGNRAVTYAVSPNNSSQQRVGYLNVGGQPFAVTQAGIQCTYEIALPDWAPSDDEGSSPREWFHGEGSEVGFVNVFTGPDCPWNTINTNDWITILWNVNGRGTDNAAYLLEANAGPERSGRIEVAGIPFTIHQARGMRVLIAEDMVVESGRTNCLDVKLEVLGTGKAVGFSLCYDTNLVTFSSARIGSGAVGGTLTLNTSQVASGRVGFSVGLPQGWSLQTGTQTVVSVCFKAAMISGKQATSLSICDQPVARSVQNVLGQPLPALYRDGLVKVIGECSLGESLDTPQLTWVTGGEALWSCQTNMTHDGEDAAWSGAVPDGGEAWLETTVNGPGTLTYWWKVSSEPGSDRLRLYLDGSSQLTLSGEVDWEFRTFSVPAGSHAIRWRYNKNSTIGLGQDRAWVDQVTYEPAAPAITRQPISQGVDNGSTAIFTVIATGTPLTYQWRFNGADLANGPLVRGATTATLSISNVQPANAGNYSVVINNAVGALTSDNASLSVMPVIPLADALDAPALSWRTVGTPSWVGQAIVSHDGDAARSGTIIDSQTTSFETTVVGPGTVSFWWKVSSEPSSDRIMFYIAGNEMARVSGEVDWVQQSFPVPSGSQVLTWTYRKNSSVSEGQDRGWVDQVTFGPTPVSIETQPAGQNVDSGSTVNFGVAAAGAPPLTYQWQSNGVNLINGPTVRGATTAALTLSNVPLQSATYTVVVANGAGMVSSAGALLTVTPLVTLAAALDTSNIGWTTNGTPPWVGQAAVTHDGTDAARSGAIGDSGTTSFLTTVNGPGTVSFWWKVSSESGSDRLRFYRAGSSIDEISGEVDWTWRTYTLAAGSQALEWRFSKNSSGFVGQDRAWVDEVVIISNSVPTAPIIGMQPVNQTVVAPGTATFRVGAVGSASLSYQWQFNGFDLLNGNGVSGATTTNLTLTGVQGAQAGSYSVVVSNSAGTTASSSALLTVVTSPVITNQPAGTNVIAGATVNLFLGAIGAPTLAYQWRFNGAPLVNGGNVSGATSGALRLTGIQAAQAGTYVATVTNGSGSATSIAVTVAVSTPPSITTQPLSRTVTAGNNVSFSVIAGGSAPLTYQWRSNGTNLIDGAGVSGATSPILVLGNVQAAQAGSYLVVVSNLVGGATSSSATLTIISPPSITAQPVSQTVSENLTVLIGVGAAGSAPLSYQWRFNGSNLANGIGVSGATTPNLTLSNAPPGRSGNYSVSVSNAAGIAISSNAVLQVIPGMTLGEAVDATYLTWSTGLGTPWLAQTAVSIDGVGAARSGNIATNQNTWIETIVTGPGAIRFWWKVSSQTNADILKFLVGGAEVANLSGNVDWRWESFDVPAGEQALRWSYAKDGSITNGQDRAWLDEVEFVPSVGPVVPRITSRPLSQNVDPGTTVTMKTTAEGTPPLSYQWYHDGFEIVDGGTVSGAKSSSLTMANVQADQEGAYQVVVRNSYSLDVSATALLTVIPVISLAQALDTDSTNLNWITAGASPWRGQEVVSHDRVDAAESGVLANLKTNWMETSVIGPAAVTFWWKVSSQTNSDRLRFYINGVEQANISGEVDWRWRTFDIAAASAVLRWAYAKDASGSAGQDRGWVDLVELGPSAPVITNQSPRLVWAEAGVTVMPRADVTGTSPFQYQWRLFGTNMVDGSNVFGATSNRRLTISNALPSQSGVYSLVVNNASGSAVSEDFQITIAPVLPLAPALSTPVREWRTGGESLWIGTTEDNHDGNQSARPAGPMDNSSYAWMETTFAGPGTLRFWWKASTEATFDFLNVTINGVEMSRISGSIPWQQKTFDVLDGAQIVRWQYSKSGLLTNGQDKVWVDEVTFGATLPTITNNPVSRAVDAGSTVNLSVGARGTPPLIYQWRFNGAILANGGNVTGANSNILTLSNIQPAQGGSYSVSVTNAAGLVLSSNAVVTVTPVLPLPISLDATNLNWSTTGTPVWVGQPIVTHDGVDAARSGALVDGQSASFQATVSGPGNVTFWWKVSSELNRDFLQFLIDGTAQAEISGEVDWQSRTFPVPAGTQVLRWTYFKNGSLASGQDRGWVDQVQFTAVAAVITAQPVNQTVDAGATATFSVTASGTPPLGYQWRRNGAILANGNGVSGATNATLTLTGVQLAQAGAYSLVISNGAGTVTSANATLTVIPVLTLAEALDTTSLTWTTNGAPPWVGQPLVNHDGIDAARSGAIADGQNTYMQTTITGPGSISFWWKVSSQTNSDFMSFQVNGTEQGRISGEVDWQLKTFDLPAGSQILRWTYTKNGSTSLGQDRAWVDQVQFGLLPPAITSQPINQVADAGSAVSFRVVSGGTPPLTYQWRFNGANLANGVGISGATSATLTVTNLQPAQAGNYSVLVSNSVGTTTSVNASLTVVSLVPLGLALDRPDLNWITTGTPSWVGHPGVTHDGTDAARSGAIPDGQTTSFETTVTGPGTVTFWWKVSSEPSSDRVVFYINGTEQARISGEVDWQQRSFPVNSGSQVLTWTYRKNSSVSQGQDTAWVDEVQFGVAPVAITSHPASQNVDSGANVTFNILASGGAPLGYQWRLNGASLANGGNITGANTSSLNISSVQAAQAGTYSVVVSNAAGTAVSSNATLAVTTVLALAEALDATGFSWTTTGTPAWVGQGTVTHDGADAARSGTIANSQSTSFETSVTGPGIVTFWWKVSSETNNDALVFLFGASEQARISGEVNWQQRSFNVPAGAQILRWSYLKNGTLAAGQDFGWVDTVQFGANPVSFTTQPVSQSVDAGSTVAFSAVATGGLPLSYQWRLNGANLANGGNISGADTATLTLSGVQPAQAGTYSVVVSNPSGVLPSANATLSVAALLPLAESLDAPGYNWTTTGTPAWAGQASVTHDGTDAARSGAITHGQSISFEAPVTGPGTVTFWWKVSSETNNDPLLFLIGSTEQAGISGEVNWQLRTFNVPAGSQVLRWTYTKNGSVSIGQDRAWVDQMQFTPTGLPVAPQITSPPASQNVGEGGTANFSVTASGSAPLIYQWRFNGLPLDGATASTLSLPGVSPTQVGTYSVTVSNTAGTVTSSGATLSLLTLAQAVDAPGLTFNLGGNAGWIAQTTTTHDGSDAASSGAISTNENSRLEAWVTGPGIITFWWKISSEPVNDQLRFYVGASEMARIDGEVNWQFLTFNVPAGPDQLLKWRYSKNATVNGGQDRGWVDQVTYTPTAGANPIPDPGTNAAPSVTNSLPIVASISMNESKVSISWEAAANKTYQVFYKDSLADADWKVVDSEVTVRWRIVADVLVTDSVLATLEDVVGGSSRFYRVVED